MRNIIKIFLTDAKRIATNVVALVMILGLSVIPCLYAWFNILSNWDPYGEESTGNLSVAVASADAGMDFDGVTLNVGDTVISTLKENKTINWIFPETPEEAVDGVYSGEYYAAFVIPEDFSENMVSFLGGDATNPTITYYENEKKNAIAPKITGKVKTTVQREVNSAFVSTLAKVLMEASEYVVASDGDEDLSSAALDKLNSLDDDITTCVTIINSYIGLIDSANSVMDAASVISDEMDTMMDTADSMVDTADSAADSAEASVDSVSELVDATLLDLNNQLDTLSATMTTTINTLENASKGSMPSIAALQTAVSTAHTTFDTTMSSNNVAGMSTDCADGITKVDADFDAISADLTALQTAATKTYNDAYAIYQVTLKDINTCQTDLTKLRNDYKNTVEPQLKNTVRSLKNSLSEAENLLNYSSDAVSDVASILDSYPDMMALGKENLVSSRDEILEMQSQLEELITDVEDLQTDDQYALLVKLTETDPAEIADFISEPIELDQENVFPIANNGSAAAPFYIVLSIWVGGLIICTLIKTKVAPVPGLTNVRKSQEFFGRYIVYFLIGQVQTLITVLGALFYVKIQCLHPFLFWLAAAVTSFAFTLLMYAMTYAWASVGQALAVVLMVIQVAGSGGTFPVEVLPELFQKLYGFMPFAYAMNAIRETIGGMYHDNYWIYLFGMGVYIIIGLIIGLFLAKPCEKLNELIEESLEKTDVM